MTTERALICTDPWPLYHLGSTYPLDLVRSRLSIATASVSLTSEALSLKAASASLSSIPIPHAKHALASAYHTSSNLAPSLNQAAAGAAASVYTKADLTIWGMTLKIVREEGGVKGLYRGLITTAVGVAPYVGVNFAAYEFLRGVITPPGKSNIWRKLSCGALAGQ